MANQFGFVSEETYIEKMDVQNQFLAGIMAGVGGSIKPTGWSDVQTLVRAGLANKVFTIGDQLVCKKGDDTLVWDIIGIDHDIPADTQFKHSLTLQLHDGWKDSMQFDNYEAMYVAETELAAGTYNFTIATTWDNALAGTYQFTLTKALPAGGCIAGLDRLPLNEPSTWKVSTYNTTVDTTVIETVNVTSGSSGQSLGSLTPEGTDNLNSIHKVSYGSNNYKESAIRQWLNSDKPAGSVWVAKSKYDRPPVWVAEQAGFLNGIDADFLAVIGKTKLVVSRNTITDGGGFDELEDKIFLTSRSETYGGNESANITEGEPYPYYANYSNLTNASTGSDSNRIKYRNDLASVWWLRTPVAGGGCYVRAVNNTGGIVNYNVASSLCIAPTCNIV